MTLLTSMMEQSAVRCLGWTLLHFVWQAALIAGLLMILRPALAGISSHKRYLVLCGAMASMAVAPVVTWCWMMAALPAVSHNIVASTTGSISSNDSGSSSVVSEPITSSVIADDLGGSVTSTSPVSDSSTVTGTNQRSVKSPGWTIRLRQLIEPGLTWLVGIWLLGVLVLSIRLLTGWRVVQRLRRLAVTRVADLWQTRLKQLAERLRVTRPITLMESALVEVPTVIGWLRPMILLPTSFLTGLSPDQVESILVHELAHIRRHDFVVNLVQTTIEVLLFYHPAVWWLSNRIREEREHCCDDTAVAFCGDTYMYARALATMEELRLKSPQQAASEFALAAGGGSLLQRIRRLAVGTPDARQSNWWGASVFVIAMVAGLALAVYTVSHATEDPPVTKKPSPAANKASAAEVVAQTDGAKAAARKDIDWGAESNGIRFRIIPVPTSSDDDAPDLSKTTSTFTGADSMTFAVELKNVSEQPITLMGLRYGDSYATAVGKLNASFFGPHLFDMEFTDANGKPVSRPSRALERDMLALSGVSTHTLAPGQSLVELLRPARFMFPMNYDIAPGQYRLKMKYHGPSEAVTAEIKKHWPDKSQAVAWTHSVTSNEVAFTVAPDPADMAADKLVWGPVKDGLQAAIELRRPRPTNGAPGSVGSPNEAPGVPTKSTISVVFHVKNVSDKNITFSSETGRQGDTIQVTDEAGKAVAVSVPWYSGWPIMVRWVLKPGEVADLNAFVSGLDTIEKPGKYTVQYTIRFNSMQSKDAAGNVTFPLKEDWQSELTTGVTPFFLRTRTPEDDAREKPPTFVGRIEFTGPDVKTVDSGVLTWNGEIPNKEFTNRAFGRGPIEIPESTLAPASVTVRAAGFEQAVFQDVKLKPNEIKRFELVPAAPARIKLVSIDGEPVAGAKIRFFNKNSGLASSGPIPMDGFEGPVWATTGADGVAVIDSMQRVDPYYKKLGDAIYFFCIEAPALNDGKPLSPPRVIGPVKAGQDLGVVVLGPPLEVRGEIRGTAEELKRFAAEWDQPFAMKTDNPEATWDYAVSKKLETKQEGDKLSFHLTGLTPGRLRIIANFGPPPRSVSHTYSRRDPKEGDTVVDVELKESLSNLIINAKGRVLPDK